MRRKISIALISLLCTFCATISYAQINELPRCTPEEQGVPSKALTTLFDSLVNMPGTDIHSVIVMRHGKIIGEIYPTPFAPQYAHTQYSSSKTLVSMAVGIAVDQNRLRITDRVAAFFPELLPKEISPELASITVRDLLTMTSGIKPDWGMRAKCTNWVETFLSKPVVNKPGETFAYDSMVTYMLAAIVQKVTGKTLLEYLKENLFSHMNITQVNWEISPEGINTGGWGLHIQSESLAKVGQMWLDGGVWNGKQLISKEWIEQMSKKQANGGDYGYGFQTWQCAYQTAVRADGALGQYVIVIPKQDVVIVLTEASFTNGKPQRGLIWNGLMKAIEQAEGTALVAGKDYQELAEKQKSYQLPVVDGKKDGAGLKKIIGKKIEFTKNKFGFKEVTFNKGVNSLDMVITKTDGSTYTQPLGYKNWLTGEIAGYPPYSINPIGWEKGLEEPFYAAGSYGVTKEGLKVKIHYVNWVTALEILVMPDKEGKTAKIEIRTNYSKTGVTKIDGTL